MFIKKPIDQSKNKMVVYATASSVLTISEQITSAPEAASTNQALGTVRHESMAQPDPDRKPKIEAKSKSDLKRSSYARTHARTRSLVGTHKHPQNSIPSKTNKQQRIVHTACQHKSLN
jgi:hypothetical protein